jgi:methionyl-tRNA synthetase
VILNLYTPAALEGAFGIDMASLDLGVAGDLGIGGSWGRVAPGVRSDPHQHDEIETFVIVAT